MGADNDGEAAPGVRLASLPAHDVAPEEGGWFVVENPQNGEREVAYCARVARGLVWTLMGHWELLPLESRIARKRVVLTG